MNDIAEKIEKYGLRREYATNLIVNVCMNCGINADRSFEDIAAYTIAQLVAVNEKQLDLLRQAAAREPTIMHFGQ
jgi:hypothetical protein